MCTISLLAYKMFFERTHFDEQAGDSVWQLSTAHGPAKCTQIKAQDNTQVRVACPGYMCRYEISSLQIDIKRAGQLLARRCTFCTHT